MNHKAGSDDFTRDVVKGPITLKDIPVAPHGAPGFTETRTYLVTLPWWVRQIRHAAEAVVSWTRRFETHTRIR